MCTPTPANRHGVDYAHVAEALGPPPTQIIDAHSHLHGPEAVRIYKNVMELFGVEEVWSMTHLEHIPEIQAVLGSRFRPIAVPDFRNPDFRSSMGKGYRERLPAFKAHGAQLAKFWCAPRAADYASDIGDPACMRLDSPMRRDAIQCALDLGMGIMVHVADPDSWFRVKYTDTERYGTKLQQYEPLETILAEIAPVPLLAAHMGGWPEDLNFLTGLLTRHENLVLDTSAAKWMIRELSLHSTETIQSFFRAFRGRLLFGTDNVTMDDHLGKAVAQGRHASMTQKSASPTEAFDLYASRYAALRTLFETNQQTESPIADPDLEMEHPESYGPLDAPILSGKSIPIEDLCVLYRDAASSLSAALCEGGS